jgi:hypothetical protein
MEQFFCWKEMNKEKVSKEKPKGTIKVDSFIAPNEKVAKMIYKTNL